MKRLQLIAHGPAGTAAEARFPADDGLLRADFRLSLPAKFAFYTAPERRARETAAQCDGPAIVSELLRDRDCGAWSGRLVSDVGAEDPEALARWSRDPLATAPGGESLADVVERFACFLAEAEGDFVAAVTHAWVMRAALVYLLGVPPEVTLQFDIEPLARMNFTNDERRWKLRFAAPASVSEADD